MFQLDVLFVHPGSGVALLGLMSTAQYLLYVAYSAEEAKQCLYEHLDPDDADFVDALEQIDEEPWFANNRQGSAIVGDYAAVCGAFISYFAAAARANVVLDPQCLGGVLIAPEVQMNFRDVEIVPLDPCEVELATRAGDLRGCGMLSYIDDQLEHHVFFFFAKREAREQIMKLSWMSTQAQRKLLQKVDESGVPEENGAVHPWRQPMLVSGIAARYLNAGRLLQRTLQRLRTTPTRWN